jgi:hypothetical protein
MKLPALLIICIGAAAADADDAWFDDDAEKRALAVNEGELVFLTNPPEKATHHHANLLEISETSLRDGWVKLEQCHANLDAVPEAQIVFAPKRLRHLQVSSLHAIGEAFVEGASVQLRDVQRGASLCLQAETQALHLLGDGFYELRNGPYMRRFLDGYYPIRVSLDIRYPASLALIDHTPDAQPGFRPDREPQRVLFDTWFEGRLQTRFRFTTRGP